MAKRASKQSSSERKRINLSIDPKIRQDQIGALAEEVVVDRMLDGTVSSAVLCHYLKLNTVKYQLELETMRHNNALLEAKTESIKASSTDGELYLKAINAMRIYSGQKSDDDYDED